MPCGELVSGTKKFIAQNKKRNVQLLYNGIQTIGGTSEPYDFTEEAVTPRDTEKGIRDTPCLCLS